MQKINKRIQNVSHVNSSTTGMVYIVLTHKWLLVIKQRKTSLQFRIPENLDNKQDPKRNIYDLIYLRSRKRKDLLSKLGA